MKLANNKATLSFSNGSPSIDMPVYNGSIGPDVIDIRKLYGQTGLFTYDPGFMSTAACNSNGYRPLVQEILKKRFPNTAFTFINAGIGSTCSNTGAFRLDRDVLQ